MSRASELTGHLFFFLVMLPIYIFVPSGVLGSILAAAEGWDAIDGLLYVGGDLVFYVLTTKAPTTAFGRALDFFISCLALGIFSWLMALIGSLPFIDHTTAFLRRYGESALTGGFFLFVCVVLPVTNLVLALIFGVPLSLVEGWSYLDAALYAEGLMVHCPALAPAAVAPTSTFGKVFVFLIAIYGLGIAIGWAVGVLLAFPGMDRLADLNSKYFGLSEFTYFVLFILIGVPLYISPLVFGGGAILAALEGWPAVDSFVFVGGNLLLIPLSTLAPTTTGGRVVAYFMSCFSLGVFAFVIAAVGALKFVDTFTERLGGKVKSCAASAVFTYNFFLVVMPLVSIVVAVILGAVIMGPEGWSFEDSFLFVTGILIQSPSIAPASVVPTSTAGQLIVILCGSYSVSMPIGLGAGAITASAGMDWASERIRAKFANDFADQETEDEQELSDDFQISANLDARTPHYAKAGKP